MLTQGSAGRGVVRSCTVIGLHLMSCSKDTSLSYQGCQGLDCREVNGGAA